METLVVLDYSIGEVCYYDLLPEENVLKKLAAMGHKESECSYMVTEHLVIRDNRFKA